MAVFCGIIILLQIGRDSIILNATHRIRAVARLIVLCLTQYAIMENPDINR